MSGHYGQWAPRLRGDRSMRATKQMMTLKDDNLQEASVWAHEMANISLDEIMDLLEVYTALQPIIASINYACGVLLKRPQQITLACNDDRWRWFQASFFQVVSGMTRFSGFGWDDTDKMVQVDSEQKEPEAKEMLNRPFPYYEDWQILFGKDRATGEMEGPVDTVHALDREEEEEEEENVDKDDSSPIESKGSKKRGRATDGDSAGPSSMANSFGKFFEATNHNMAYTAKRIGYAQDLFEARKKVYGVLLKLPLDIQTRMKAASMIA
ncbi:hypothetical protein U1Q18_048613 [Sarracenia purpurea var. burkii]